MFLKARDIIGVGIYEISHAKKTQRDTLISSLVVERRVEDQSMSLHQFRKKTFTSIGSDCLFAARNLGLGFIKFLWVGIGNLSGLRKKNLYSVIPKRNIFQNKEQPICVSVELIYNPVFPMLRQENSLGYHLRIQIVLVTLQILR